MVFWISDDIMKDHFCPWPNYHIEVPQRLEVIKQRMEDCDFYDRVTRLPIRIASHEELELVHTKRYIEDIKHSSTLSGDELEAFSANYEDIYVNNNSYNIAKIAAAAAIDLVRNVFDHRSSGFASIRPPGHHASPDAGCGFCIFNNVVIAAKNILNNGANRVLIVDWDVHAGQGTQDCIEDCENIRLVSIHRFEDGTFWPNLQQSDIKTDFKNTVNVPLNKTGMTDSDFIAIMQLVVVPMIQDYQPDVIIVSCGFDAAFGDPEGEMAVTPGGFGTMANILLNMGIPTAFILEGGYFLDSVAACSEFVLRAMLKDDAPHINFQPLSKDILPVIRRIHKHFSKQYPSFESLSRLSDDNTTSDNELVDEMPEFRGVRHMLQPYPTRGLYKARDEEFEQDLLAELDDIVNAYKKASYPNILLEESNSLELVRRSDDIIIKLPKSLMRIAFQSLILPINPITRPPALHTEQPALDEIISFKDFLLQVKNDELFKGLSIYKVYKL